MIRIAVCDDDPEFLKQAEQLSRRFFAGAGVPAEISCYQDGESLLAENTHYDIYLLDILMPGMDGITLARELAARDRDFCVIYLTTSEEYALDAFSVDALQYLVKPVGEAALSAALKKAEALLAAPKPEAPRLAVPTRDGTVSVLLSSLCYAEYLDRVLYFHMADGTVYASSTASMKISDLSTELLALPNFLSPHRAFLVNMDYIHTFSSGEIQMEHGEAIPVVRTNGREVRRQYMDYLLRKKGGTIC